VTSGRPLLAIRTSCVAFDTNKDQITDANNHVLEQWKEFDRNILGGNYHGHLKEGTDIALVSGMENHPLLRDVKPFNSLNWLYQCAPLRSDKAQVLQTGSNPDKPPEPS
jgi:hypothetical protein